MNIIAKPEVRKAAEKCGVTVEVEKWYHVTRKTKWQSPVDVREYFPSAEKVDDYNRHRLILKVNFRRKTLYFVGIFTHKEYDRKRWRKGCRQPATKKLDLEQYGKLLAAFVPRPIETEVERKRMSAAIKAMLNKDLTPEEEVLFQLLVKLVTDYEDQLVQISEAPPGRDAAVSYGEHRA